jgi:hypothetical protein
VKTTQEETMAKADNYYRILGQVVDLETKRGVAGLRVEAWDKDFIFSDSAGSAATDERGGFRIDFEATRFRDLFLDRQPDLFFKVFRGKQLIKSTEDSILWNLKVGETKIAIEVDFQIVQPQTFIVRGSVRQADGTPMVGVLVRAFDIDLRSKELLGEAKTDQKGSYEIKYTHQRFRRAEKKGADLTVSALNQKEEPLASSSIIFNAKPVETVDLVIGGAKYRGPSEFEQLVSDLTPLLQGLSFAELTEDDKHQDVNFLSGETGLDPGSIAFLIVAHRLLKETGMPAEVFYGLFRQGLPVQLPALLAQSQDVQRRALVRSAQANIIPFAFANKVDAIMEQFKTVVVRQAMKQPTVVGRATLNDLLSVPLQDAKLREEFLSAYANHTGPVEVFWKGLAERPEFKDRINDVQRTLQLGTLTGNHPPLMHELQRMQQAGKITTLSDLARFDEKGWMVKIIAQVGDNSPIGFPPGVPGKDDQEKARNYARALAHMVEDAFPTTFVARRIETDDLPGKDDLLVFFNANPGFELKSTRLGSYLKEHPDALANVQDVKGTKQRIQAIQRIYKLAPRYTQASALLKGGLDSAHAITRMGENVFLAKYGDAVGGQAQAKMVYAKAQQVQALALNLFTEFGLSANKVPIKVAPDEAVLEVEGVPEWSTLFGSLELCECEHCRSVYSPAAYLVDVLHFLKDRPSKVVGKNAKDVLFLRRPDLGEIELTCENTNTPLPYVDLVNEALEHAVAPCPTFAPFNLPAAVEANLNSRNLSPDLSNAFNPPLSGVAVITVGKEGQLWDVDPEWWTIDEPAFTYTIRKENGQLRVVARSLQTKDSAAARSANPQYVNANAYGVLRQAVYPWSLPFDLWVEEARAYLGHLGVPRYQIMETFQPGERNAILNGAGLAREYLGLTSAQATLITGVTTSQPGTVNPGRWNLWGFEAQNLSAQHSIPDPSDRTRRIAGGNWLNVLRGRVDVFLQQSGLKYKEMLDLLDTYYVNPVVGNARTIRIVSTDPDNPDTCETDKLYLEGFDQAAAARSVRFVRLWRALGWSMRDIDRAITAFKPPHFSDLDVNEAGGGKNDGFLVNLSHVQRLNTKLGLPLIRLLSWWATLDSAFYIDHNAPGQPRAASLYEQLFRNRATINPPDPAFTENPANLAGTLSGHAAAITAALGTSASDFAMLLDDGNVIPRNPDDDTKPDDILNLSNLSRLHRHSSLAKALSLSSPDYLASLRLIAPDPFATTTATVTFVETVDKVRDTGFTFAEVDYLLRHALRPELPIAPSDEAIAALLDELRAGLQKIAEENTFRADPDDPAGPTIDLDGDLTRQKLALLNWDRAWVDQAIATLNGALVYEAPLASLPDGLKLPNATGIYAVALAALPAGFAIPIDLGDLVAFDAAKQKLTAARFLGQPERDKLQSAANAAGDTALSDAVAALFLEQDELQGEIAHDAQRHVIRFTGPMTNRRKARLDTASNDAAYRTTVQALYDSPRRFISRAMAAFAVHDFVTDLAALPAGVKLPNALKRKVYFDASTDPKRLHCLGVMSEQERDTLLTLSTNAADPNHAAYQAAVNALFAKAEVLVPAASDAFLTAAGANNDAATMFDRTVAFGDRFQLVLKKLLPYLRSALSERLVVQKMSEALQLETLSTDALLRTWLASPVDTQPNPAMKRRCLSEYLDPAFAESNTNIPLTPVAFPAQFKTFLRAHKAALVASRFELTHRQLGWIFTYGTDAGWLDLNSLPTDGQEPGAKFDGWLRLAELVTLRDGLPQGEKALDELLTRARAVNAGDAPDAKDAAKQSWFAAVTRWTKWQQTDLEALLGAADDHAQTGQFNATFPDDYLGERLLVRLREALGMLNRLGMPAQQAADLVAGDVTQSVARGVRQAVRAKYDETQWLNLAKPLRDALREKQRAALVAYLVAHIKLPQNVRDANDLYAHFLIDVEMDPCMMTSRIKQAISSVQLFVQRCLMNLEPNVTASAAVDVKWREWKWMKNYRVWEANRKIFLYAENWIEPELRDDKSPFFRELESELLQSDLNLETAEEAFLHYLEKLGQVARLEVVAVHHQVENDTAGNSAVDMLHVFARTPGIPHVYFYRRRVDSAFWTAWERIDLDIEGEHLIPVVWNRRLLLFWPIFTEKAYLPEVTFKDGNLSDTTPIKYWEIKLAWSERKQNAWTSKRVSSQAINTDCFANPFFPKDTFFLRTFVDPQTNSLYVLVLDECYICGKCGRPDAAFRFDGCYSEPTVANASSYMGQLIGLITGTVFDRMFFRENGDRMLYLPAPTDTQALAKTPGTFLLLPYPDGSSIAQHPFFYQDDKRIFFVIPSEIPGHVGKLPKAEMVDPGFIIEITKYYWKEVQPFPDLIGPIINPQDPWINDPSFPISGFDMYHGQLGSLMLSGGNVGNLIAGVGLEKIICRLTAGGKTVSKELMKRAMSRPVYSPMALTMSRDGLSTVMPDAIDMLTSTPTMAMPMAMSATASIWSSYVLSPATAVGFDWYGFHRENRFLFQTFYHPYVCAFVRELNRNGVDGLLQRRMQTHPHEFALLAPNLQPLPPLDFKAEYEPHKVSNPIVMEPYPVEGIVYDPNAPNGHKIVGLDFNEDGAYALYNWELFFHAPLMIADRLSKNQRYEDAQKWFHYIFDPTDTSSTGVPQRYWRTKPFHERTREGYQRERIQYILKLLAAGADPQKKSQLSPDEENDLKRFEKAVAAWRKDPFKPHLIARMRTTAYQKTVVMKYLNNLIAWADQLFRRDTIESINEATQLYILAAEILGRRPEEIPPRATPRVQTYNSLEPSLDALSNALVQIEEFVSPSANGDAAVGAGQQPSLTLPAMLYFCVPKNDKLLAYWDTVADRLFKIRHCMNIEGVVRQLPLFEPPIDPGLLVKAVAAGVDLSSVLNDLSAALPHYRFNGLAQKATELCAELKSLGQAMLSAMEKRDAEQLSLLRAQHETALLGLVEQVRKLQYDEAKQNKTALSKSRDTAVSRYLHYQKLLGVQSPQVPGMGQPIPEGSPSQHVVIQEQGGIKKISYEQEEMDKLKKSDESQDTAAWTEFAASFAHVVPNFNIEPWGVGPTFGGSNVGSAISAFASRFRADATKAGYEANKSAKLGQYALRAHDWLLQSNLAAREIMQIDQQYLAADLRSQIAEKELANHSRQLANAREVEEILRDKYTNQELYGWMIGQLATVYFQVYQLAYDLAKRAERAFRHELGLKDSNFIQFGYWDSLKKGLLAGERLFLDLKRMEVAYLDQHKREYEITKHVSLAQLDPLALIQLRQTGTCIVRMPEALFDLDFPGHYMRRMRTVSVSIPCVTGPYTGVNCTLTLLRSSVRHGNTLLNSNKYARQEGDPRFTDSLGAIQSVAASSGQNDSGLFETNLRDERFLPFEGAGVISEWQIELPAAFRQFDYNTISDVILHLRYSAREGGGLLKEKAAVELQAAVNEFIHNEGQQGLAQIFSLPHEFSTEWHRFLHPVGDIGDNSVALEITKDRFPFLFQGRPLTVGKMTVFVKVKPDFVDTHNDATVKLTLSAGNTAPTSANHQSSDLLSLAPWNGLLRAEKTFNQTPGNWTMNAWLDDGNGPSRLEPNAIAYFVVLCQYTVG